MTVECLDIRILKRVLIFLNLRISNNRLDSIVAGRLASRSVGCGFESCPVHTKDSLVKPVSTASALPISIERKNGGGAEWTILRFLPISIVRLSKHLGGADQDELSSFLPRVDVKSVIEVFVIFCILRNNFFLQELKLGR